MDVLAEIGRAKVLPVVRRPSAEAAISMCGRLLAQRSRVIELTATTPEWTRVLAEVQAADPQVALGLGTVTRAAIAEKAITAGAAFLVSPYPAPEVRRVALQAGVPFIEGGFSPGELAESIRHGVAKLFPASSVGPGHLNAILDVLPGARIIPTGGITPHDVDAWLAAGAYAVGMGSAL